MAKNRIRNIFKNAWTQDGLQPDPTRLRLDDATPIYSGWLRRAFLSTENRASACTISFLTTLGLALDGSQEGMVNAIAAMSGIIFFNAGFRRAHRRLEKLLFDPIDSYCFNIDPESQIPTSANHMRYASGYQKTLPNAIKLAGVSSGALIMYLVSNALELDPEFPGTNFSQEPLFVLLSAYTGKSSIYHLLKVHRLRKIANGEWTIEDTPPGQKKPAREKTTDKIADKIKSMLPQPAFAPNS